MLVALLAQQLIATLPPLSAAPTWAIQCTRTLGLRPPGVVGTPEGNSLVVIAGLTVRRYDSKRGILSGRSDENGKTLTFRFEARTVVEAGVDPIEPGDAAMLRLIVDAPCSIHIDDVEIDTWVSDARISDVFPRGFRFDKLDYHTGLVDDRLARQDGFAVPEIAVPLPHAVFSADGEDRSSLDEFVPGMRVKIYGRKSPRSKFVRFFRVEKF